MGTTGRPIINGASSMGEYKNSFSSLQKSEQVLALLASPIIPLMGMDFSVYPVVDTERVVWSECTVSGQKDSIHVIVSDVGNKEQVQFVLCDQDTLLAEYFEK